MKNLKDYVKAIVGAAIIFVVSVGIGILLLVLGDRNDLTWLTVIGFVVFVFGLAFALVWFVDSKDKARAKCAKCGKSMKGGAYTWEMESEEDVYSNDGNHYVKYKYDVHCTCPHCGAEKQFKKKLTLKASENPDVSIRNYLSKLFKNKK